MLLQRSMFSSVQSYMVFLSVPWGGESVFQGEVSAAGCVGPHNGFLILGLRLVVLVTGVGSVGIWVYESLSPFRGVPIYSSSLHRLPIREFQVLVPVGDSFRWQTSHFVGRCRPESIRAWSCLQSANRSGVPFFIVPIHAEPSPCYLPESWCYTLFTSP